jgi:hypothetical protein
MGDNRLQPTLSNLVQASAETRLAAAWELRRQADLLVEDLIGQVLRQEQRPTWEQIGRILGIPESTAYNRYGKLTPEAKRRRRGKRIVVKGPPPWDEKDQQPRFPDKEVDHLVDDADYWAKHPRQPSWPRELEDEDEDQEGDG